MSSPITQVTDDYIERCKLAGSVTEDSNGNLVATSAPLSNETTIFRNRVLTEGAAAGFTSQRLADFIQTLQAARSIPSYVTTHTDFYVGGRPNQVQHQLHRPDVRPQV